MSDPKYPEIVVNLSECDGNAYMLMAKVRKALKRGGISEDEQNAFTEEAKSGDYFNVIDTCEKWVTVE